MNEINVSKIEWQCRHPSISGGEKIYDITEFVDFDNVDNLVFSISRDRSMAWSVNEIRISVFDFSLSFIDEEVTDENLKFSNVLNYLDGFSIKVIQENTEFEHFTGVNDKIFINRKDDVVELPIIGHGAITNKIKIGQKVTKVSDENYKKWVYKTSKAKAKSVDDILLECIRSLNQNTRWNDWSYHFERSASQINLESTDWIITKPFAYASHKIVAGLGKSRLSLWQATKDGSTRLFLSKGAWIGKTFRIVVLKNGLKVLGVKLWDGDFDWGFGLNTASAFRIHPGGGLGKNGALEEDSWKPDVDYIAKIGGNSAALWEDIKDEFREDGYSSPSRLTENTLNIDRNVLSRVGRIGGFGAAHEDRIISASLPENANFGIVKWESRASNYKKKSLDSIVSDNDKGDWCDIVSFCFKPGAFEKFNFEFIDKSVGSVLKDLSTLLNCVLYISNDRTIHLVDTYYFSENPLFQGFGEVVLKDDYILDATEEYISIPFGNERGGSNSIPTNGWELHPDIVSAWSDYLNKQGNNIYKDIKVDYLLAADPDLSYSNITLLSKLVTDFGYATIDRLDFGSLDELSDVVKIDARIKTFDRIRSEDVVQTDFADSLDDWSSGDGIDNDGTSHPDAERQDDYVDDPENPYDPFSAPPSQ